MQVYINQDEERHMDSEIRTELGDEEEEHNDGGSEGYNAASESSAVEILIDLRVGIQAPDFPNYTLHHLIRPINTDDFFKPPTRRTSSRQDWPEHFH